MSGRKWLSAAALGAAFISLGGCAKSVAVPEWNPNRPRHVDCSVAYSEPETCHGHGRGRSRTASVSGRGDVAGRPPNLNVDTTCEAAGTNAGTVGRNKQACLEEEHTAMELLAKNWSQYNSEQKIQCTGMTRNGGPPSYVELIACLDIMKDSAAIR